MNQYNMKNVNNSFPELYILTGIQENPTTKRATELKFGTIFYFGLTPPRKFINVKFSIFNVPNIYKFPLPMLILVENYKL